MSERCELAGVLRSIARLMAEPVPAPSPRLLPLIATVTTAAAALLHLAEGTMATMPLAGIMGR